MSTEIEENEGERYNPVEEAAKSSVAKRERWFESIHSDLKGRLPVYASDWTVESSEQLKKIAAAALFAYFTSVLPAVIFGDTLALATDGTSGLSEVLMSTGGMGILYSVFAGQGLVIVGVTGPVVFFQITVWTLAAAMKAPFLQLNAWINIWCGVMHIIVAAGGYTKLIQRVTAFAGEIFGFFISLAYIYLGARNLVDLFPKDLSADDDLASTAVHLASAFASLVLAAFMFFPAIACHHAKQWRTMNDTGRWLTQSYGVVLVLVIVTALSYLPVFYNGSIDLERLPVPYVSASKGPVTSEYAGRTGWVVHLMGSDGDKQMQLWMVFIAILPAAMLLILFFFDHNVSSIMAQDPKFNLRKPASYNFDFAVLGCCVILCGIFGLPPGNGLIPQAPLHVRALAVVEYVDTPGGKREVYSEVVEKRWSNLLQSILCLLSVFLFPVLKLIPQAVLSGTFLYMGTSGFIGNGMFDRLECIFMQADRRPDLDFIRHVPWGQVLLYTILQLVSVVIIFVISFNFFLPDDSPSVAILFPIFIAILIPFRERWIPTHFTATELLHLDPPADLAEDLAQKEADFERTKPQLAPEDISLFQAFGRGRPMPRSAISPMSSGVEGAIRTLERSRSSPN